MPQRNEVSKYHFPHKIRICRGNDSRWKEGKAKEKGKREITSPSYKNKSQKRKDYSCSLSAFCSLVSSYCSLVTTKPVVRMKSSFMGQRNEKWEEKKKRKASVWQAKSKDKPRACDARATGAYERIAK